MRVVAILAGGGIRPARLQRETVHAGAVTFGLPLVALPAIDRLGGDVVVRVLLRQVGVAARAGVGLVRGGRELRRVNKQQDFLSRRVCPGQRFVRMTLQAIAVLQTCPHRNLRREQCRDPDQNPLAPEAHALK